LLLRVEIESLVRACGGVENMIILTITAPDNCENKEEWERRVNNLMTGKISRLCDGRYIHVRERQDRGAWHSHIIAYGGGDVRSGTRWNHKGRVVYANSLLFGKWWKACMVLFNEYVGVGRISAEPVKGNIKQVSGYLSKYVTKDLGLVVEKKKRLISYGKGVVRSTSWRVMLLNQYTSTWRLRVMAVERRIKECFPEIHVTKIAGCVYECVRDAFRGSEKRDKFMGWTDSLLRSGDYERIYFRKPDSCVINGEMCFRTGWDYDVVGEGALLLKAG